MRYELVNFRGYYDKMNLWYYYGCSMSSPIFVRSPHVLKKLSKLLTIKSKVPKNSIKNLYCVFLGIFPIKDMQTPPLTFDQPFMDDEECSV